MVRPPVGAFGWAGARQVVGARARPCRDATLRPDWEMPDSTTRKTSATRPQLRRCIVPLSAPVRLPSSLAPQTRTISTCARPRTGRFRRTSLAGIRRSRLVSCPAQSDVPDVRVAQLGVLVVMVATGRASPPRRPPSARSSSSSGVGTAVAWTSSTCSDGGRSPLGGAIDHEARARRVPRLRIRAAEVAVEALQEGISARPSSAVPMAAGSSRSVQLHASLGLSSPCRTEASQRPTTAAMPATQPPADRRACHGMRYWTR